MLCCMSIPMTGAFILDNTQERPVSPMMLDYEWEAMLCGGEWRELRGWS